MSGFLQDLKKAPNLISLARIGLVWVAAAMYFHVSAGAGIALAVVAGITDYVDGAVARATGQVTRLGEILDHLGDLCLESLALLFAVAAGFFPPLVLFVYLFREFWVVSLRRFASGAGPGLQSGWLGKLKTNFLMWGFLPTFLSIAGLLPGLEPWLARAGRASVAVGLALSYASAWGYTRAFVAAYDRSGSEK